MARRNGGGRSRAYLTNTHLSRLKQCGGTSELARDVQPDGYAVCHKCGRRLKAVGQAPYRLLPHHHKGANDA